MYITYPKYITVIRFSKSTNENANLILLLFIIFLTKKTAINNISMYWKSDNFQLFPNLSVFVNQTDINLLKTVNGFSSWYLLYLSANLIIKVGIIKNILNINPKRIK